MSSREDDSWPGQLIHQAAIYNNVELLQCLLQGEEKANINAQDVCGRTALYTAVSNGSVQCLTMLLDNGADMNIAAGSRCHNMTPLHAAVLDSKRDALAILLARGADLTQRDVSGKTPLALAKYMKDRESQTIIEREQELYEACAEGKLEDVKKVLTNSGPYRKHVINMVTKGLSPLAIACKCGHADILSLLVAEGAACTSQKDTGLTFLHLACEAGNVEVIEVLLETFPDLILVRSVEHQLPLHSAVICNQVKAVKFLLDYPYQEGHLLTFTDPTTSLTYQAGIEVNAQDASGETPLHIACRSGSVEIVQLFLDYAVRVEVSKKDLPRASSIRSLNTGLEAADVEVEDDLIETCELDSNPEDPESSPERFGKSKKYYRIIRPLDVNVLDSSGLSPYHLAIKHKYVDVLEMLLEARGPPPNKMNFHKYENSVLMFAYEDGNSDVLELLLRYGLQDVDNKVLMSAIFSQEHDIKWLMLKYKCSRDPVRSINKTEMRRLAFQVFHQREDRVGHTLSIDPEFKASLPTTPVSVLWEGIGVLDKMDHHCLMDACKLHNPLLKSALGSAVSLCAITKVDISKNSFEQFPVIVLELPSLVVLKASRNQIAAIPEEHSISCFSLEELHLNENKIRVLPKFIFQLPSLKYLDVSVNRLEEMPSAMWESTSLVTLNLSNNSLSMLPNTSRDPVPLKQSTSRMSRTSLGSISGSVNLPSPVGNNDPDTYSLDSGDGAEFTLLSTQEVTTTQVIKVNKWSGAINVKDRDPWKGSGQQSSGLKQLWLNRNKFTQVPPCLTCCAPNLEELFLSDNPLSSIGLISDYPSSLVELDLSRTTLTTMDSWRAPLETSHDFMCFGPVCSLPSYKYSSASLGNNSPKGQRRRRSSSGQGFNFVTSQSSRNTTSPSPIARDALFVPCLHRGHTTLPRLEKLNLSFNRLSVVVLTRDPARLARASDTQSMCSMESEEIQGRQLFPNLAELNLSGNQLSCLPPEIGEQGCLKILSLKGNSKLRELPPKLGLLKNLWKLDLELCPLDGAIQDFLQNSRFPVKDILGFLQSVLEESTEYNCVNLMLVGFHRIGKTSLLQKLCERGRAPNRATHWRDRVNKGDGRRPSCLLSTVGIDISELVLEKRSKGPIVFRTWDFGGQKEYYATHQYFLSPRSLYLVVWSITDGERGVESLLQWLINIQARAPGASVIIVGTHLDILHDKATKRNYPEDFEKSMMELIQKMFLSNQEPDKSGLPNILRTINVSCKTGENIRQLADMIYDLVLELKHPRSKTQFLVRQKIPRKYLLLHKIIRELALERINEFKEPVLNRSKYTLCVQNKMMECGVTFRDVEELEQATRFLHENGVLFHYDDLPLRDLFFLDPQWLCDQLAKVITVKEINNFAQRGVMRMVNLEFLFKSNTFQPEHIKIYITNLLNKFEVALQFDEEHLLLPSLLPTETELLEMARKKSDVRIPVRKPSEPSVGLPENTPTVERRVESLRSNRSGRRLVEGPPNIVHVGSSMFYTGHTQPEEEPITLQNLKETNKLLLLAVKPTSNPIFSCCRLYFMTYFPSGFWPRLITRVLADSTLYPIIKDLFPLPRDLIMRSPEVKSLAEHNPEWRCWQTGFELFYLGFEMLRIREVFFSTSSYFCDYSQCKIKCSIDSMWSYIDVVNSKILEITFPTDSLKFHVASKDGPPLQNLDFSKPSSTVYREEVATTKLLVKIVEHVDNLLQDWYPDLGELRFTQNCEGRYLVTRIVPCPQCLNKEVTRQRKSQGDNNAWFFLNPDVPDMCMPVVVSEGVPDTRERSMSLPGAVESPEEQRQEPAEQATGRPRTLTEGQAFIYNRGSPDGEDVIFSWLVERCMLDVLEDVDTVCPYHGSVSPDFLLGRDGMTHQMFIAPDVAFQDQSQSLMLSSPSQLDIGPCLGKGNFGEVHEGWLYRKDNCPPEKVAIKILFKQVHDKKEMKERFQGHLDHACSAYLTARQEVSILSQLDHPHIVPLIALCLQPLSLVLMLAPQGALNTKLNELQNSGSYLPLFVIKQIVIQVSKACSYLHSRNIIYRDLKSENVLVWELPISADAHPRHSVEVKLADYGISREVLPTGTRGFGGTAPFIAPEILQHAGKGTYTDKVDVFSFGMFLFEVLTCRAPFANMNNPNNLVCQGERPSLTVQEAERIPTYMLDLMALCWSQEPEERPSMEGIIGVATSPQFCHLQDVVTLGPDVAVYCGTAVSPSEYVNGGSGSAIGSSASSDGHSGISLSSQMPEMSQIWLSCGFHDNHRIEILSFNTSRRVEGCKSLNLSGSPVVAMCVYDSLVWCADNQGLIQMFHSENLGLVHQLQLPTSSNSCVLALHPDPQRRCVLVVAADGVIYACDQPLRGPLRDERPAVVYEGEKCFCSLFISTRERSEIWLGQSKGAICVWNAKNRAMDYCLSHGPKIAKSSSSCAFLVSLVGAQTDCKYVWSYNYPGSVICMWDAGRRLIVGRLDCSHIVSTVESPVLAPSEQFNCGQVSALSAIDPYLYIGTTRGSVLITEAFTLTPLCVFQCHSASDFFIKTILPIMLTSEDFRHEARGVERHREDGEKTKVKVPAIVTIGKGYSNILKTFHPTMDTSPSRSLDDIHSQPSQAQVDPYANHSFLLSWNATDWEFY